MDAVNIPITYNQLLNTLVVPFINDDPMLVCSFVDCGVERRLRGDGALNSLTSFSKGDDLDVSIDFVSYNETSIWGSIVMQGSGSGPNASIFLIGYSGNVNNGYAWIGANNSYQSFSYTKGKRSLYRLKNKEGFWIDGVKKWSTTNLSQNLESKLNFCSSGYDKAIYGGKCKDTLNNIDWDFVPFVENGRICLLDINGLEERMVITSGSFSIEYISQDGAPWIPIR